MYDRSAYGKRFDFRTGGQENRKASQGNDGDASPPRQQEERERIPAGYWIPEGYSVEHWDAKERPIFLLGSVFDANSLGRWIFDWTAFYYGGGSPMAGVAGELWVSLIRLDGKMKRAREGVGRVRDADERGMLTDFINSGDRVWRKWEDLLKVCESPMWKVAEKGRRGGVRMGTKAGTEFVGTMFGRDRELERTQRWMSGVRLWSMRFDANCVDALKKTVSL